MDVNNTYLHLLLNADDWRHHFPGAVEDAASAVVWDGRSGEMTLRPELFRFRAPGVGGVLSPGDRRGAARDRYGTWYWIGPERRSIRVRPAAGMRGRDFWAPAEFSCRPVRPDCHDAHLFGALAALPVGDDFRPLDPKPSVWPGRLDGLAVTGQHYLVVGSQDPDGLLIFDLHGGGPPMIIRWPVRPFRVVDIAPRARGGVWILAGDDRAAGPFVLWKLDQRFDLEADEPPGTTLQPPPDFASDPDDLPTEYRLGLPAPTPIATARRVISIAALQDDSVMLLEIDEDSAMTYLQRYRRGAPAGGAVLLNEILREAIGAKAAPSWLAHDMTSLDRPFDATLQAAADLVIVGRDGNQAFAFTVEANVDDFRIELAPRYLPMRRFTGKALIATRENVYYDLDEDWIALTEQPRPRFVAEGLLEPGSSAFDGKRPDCIWHRLIMEACMPTGTSVRVESRAADSLLELAGQAWQEEPAPYRRGCGAELPFYRPDERRDRAGQAASWELLFQRAVGRYLQVRFRFSGTGRASPRVRAVRIHYPRFSYLNEYLPAVYRENAAPASFLERFLANTEGLMTELEGRIAAAQMLFDERTTPAEYLQWLAGWLGITLDGSFGEDKRRLFLAHAPQIFRERGTRQGLIRMVRLALHPCPDASLFRERYPINPGPAPARIVSRDEVRINERFLERRTGRVDQLTFSGGPAVGPQSARWTPAEGTTALHVRFRTYIQERLSAGDDNDFDITSLTFPPVAPSSPALRRYWDAFRSDRLAFPYEDVTAEDTSSYRGFLRHRYRGVDRLNAAHASAFTSFDAVDLPGERDFPATEQRLTDWLHFVSVVLPVERNAHRFIVLVSTDPAAPPGEQEAALALAARIVGEEKPAHTVFEVMPFWAVFKVGSARLGQDTVVEQGSRYLATVVGAGRLASGFLAPAHPFDIRDRVVTGRDDPGLTLQF
jgi:phage tail-like protein